MWIVVQYPGLDLIKILNNSPYFPLITDDCLAASRQPYSVLIYTLVNLLGIHKINRFF
jgi:hypothetical protein